MTQMSDHTLRTLRLPSHANCATDMDAIALWRGRCMVACAIRALVVSMLLAGCVIPPSLSVDTTGCRAQLGAGDHLACAPTASSCPESEHGHVRAGLRHAQPDRSTTPTSTTRCTPKVFVDYQSNDPKPRALDCTQAAGDTVHAQLARCDLARPLPARRRREQGNADHAGARVRSPARSIRRAAVSGDAAGRALDDAGRSSSSASRAST